MRKDLYWIEGIWPGKLGLAHRLRVGDWLAVDIDGWKRAGVDGVLSWLTAEEERDLQLTLEAAHVRMQGMQFSSFPIADRRVPDSEAELAEALEAFSRELLSGKNVLVHCRQGLGRSGLVAACLLVKTGMSPGAAVEAVSAARGLPIPETPEQGSWVDRYAASLSALK
jgi:hypothetical protein